MFRYDWTILATPTLQDEWRAAAGETGAAGADDPALRAAIAQVLAQVGGLPLAESAWSADECTARGRALLREAVLRLVRGEGRVSDLDQGHLAKPTASRPQADEVLRAVDRVGINSADETTLRGLGLGAAVAQRVMAERQRGGAFESLADLDRRVRGVGDRMVQELAHAVHFAPPSASPWGYAPVQRPYDAAALAHDMARLVAVQRGATQRARLLAALDALAVSSHGHPAVRMQRARRAPVSASASAAADSVPASWVGVWFGSAYFARLQRLIAAAQTHIDVCMFHAAATDRGHPTYRLLDALIAAQARGVAVRVLLDRDREDDPYRSTVINTPAREHLASGGVACRFDASDRLMHSKCVLVDGSYCVVGSHNWSAGSYFQFDDLSLLVASPDLHATMRARFDQLWAAAS